jgi:tubulin polyglutamylase TTLL4
VSAVFACVHKHIFGYQKQAMATKAKRKSSGSTASPTMATNKHLLGATSMQQRWETDSDLASEHLDDDFDGGAESGDDILDDGTDFSDAEEGDVLEDGEVDECNVRNAKKTDPYDFRKSKGMNDAHQSHPTLRLIKCGWDMGNESVTTVGTNYPPYIPGGPDIPADAEVEEIPNDSVHCCFIIYGRVHEYNCVRNSWHRSGFRRTSHFDRANAFWGNTPNAGLFKSLQPKQKVNHFPGTSVLGNKARLGQMLNVMHRRFGEAYSIHAETLCMPQDKRKIKAIWAAEPRSLWIIKPSNSSCGRGIRVVNGNNNAKLGRGTIVQRYLSRPYLIHNRKFDLRLYVCVTCYDPLRIYLYDDGLTRFATTDYSRNPKHLKNRFMHLTNYSVNKNNDDFVKNEDAGECGVGTKWTLKALRRYFRENGVDDGRVMRDIQDVLVKAIIAAEATVSSHINRFQLRRDNCFELYGFDVFLDEDLKPWVIEVNLAPSLSSSSPLDKSCKNNLLCDTFHLVGFQTGDPRQEKKKETKKELERLHSKGSKTGPPRRRNVFALSESSLATLPGDDMLMILEMETELKRKSNFQRIYPSFAPEVNDYYAQFFEAQRYNNTLCNLWIAACAKGKRPSLTKKSKGSSYSRLAAPGKIPRYLNESMRSMKACMKKVVVNPNLPPRTSGHSSPIPNRLQPGFRHDSSDASSAGGSRASSAGSTTTDEDTPAPPNSNNGSTPLSQKDSVKDPTREMALGVGEVCFEDEQSLPHGNVAVGSGSRAVFQARELQANPRMLTPPAFKSGSPSSPKKLVDGAEVLKRLDVSDAPPRDYFRVSQGYSAKGGQQARVPQPPFNAQTVYNRTSNGPLVVAREKRMTVSRWYQSNGERNQPVPRLDAAELRGRVAFTLNGKQTSIKVGVVGRHASKKFEQHLQF